jgi:DNA polymerase-3 subunit alpha
MDFLGLKNLTVIDRTVQAIKKRRSIAIDLDKLPRNDSQTFYMLGQGKTCGVFQFEGDGVTEVIRRLKPEKFEDLIAVNALYRPGPLGSGMVEDFIEGRHGRKKITYTFPELEPVLSETYGVIVYQEQVIKIASVIAGYSLGSADILRRAMGKKKPEVMAEQKKFFVGGAIAQGFNQKKSEKLFDLMAYFAGYGFNKSHSAAYALIAYQTAYLKAHYPAEFEAAILSFETGDPDKLREYLNKSRQAGVKILPPDINKSEIEFWATDLDKVVFGIKGIKNVGEAALNEIFEVREKGAFVDLFDFCKRVNLRVVNKRVVESLICSGAMDSLPGSRAQKMAALEDVMGLAQQEKDRESKGQIDLFTPKKDCRTTPSNSTYQFKLEADWSQKLTLEKEKEVIGFYVSSHPLDPYKDLEQWLGTTSMGVNVATVAGQEVRTLGVQTALKCILTKKGDRMAFMNLEDQAGECEVIVFPGTFLKVEEHLNEAGAFVVVGQADRDSNDKLKIKAQELFPVEKLFELNSLGKTVRITLPANFFEHDLLPIKQTASSNGFNLIFEYQENGTQLQMSPAGKFSLTMHSLRLVQDAGCAIKIELKPTMRRKF